MPIANNTIALLAILVCLAGMAWALLWPWQRRIGTDLVSNHWELVYVDDDGVLLMTLVRVQSVNHETRRLTGWCAVRGAPRVFKLRKILRATDASNGRRIDVSRATVGGDGRISVMDKPVAPASTSPEDAGSATQRATLDSAKPKPPLQMMLHRMRLHTH